MSAPISSFADIIRPMSEDEFFATYHNNQPVHIPAERPDKFADAISWQILTRLLNMTAVWSPVSLQLVLDENMLPPDRYCRQAVDRNMQRGWMPDAGKVKALMRRGASLVANDIDTLDPGLSKVATALEAAMGAKSQSNLYCSWAAQPAFDSHYDTHEVFALHGEGEKIWRVYANRVDRPIAHAAFKKITRDQRNRAKGDVLMEVTLKPGDLLYIPRGYYHDALASSAGTVHVAFGLTHVIGLDVVDILTEYAVGDALFRTDLPLPRDGEAPLRAHLEEMADRLAELTRSEDMWRELGRFRETFNYPRGGFDLPGDALTKGYVRNASDIEVVDDGGHQVLKTKRGQVPIPDGYGPLVAWVADRPQFTEAEFAATFGDVPIAQRVKVLDDLLAMKVIVAA